VLKWDRSLFQEPDADRAEALIAGAEIYTPPLLAYGLASIARTKIARYPEQGAMWLRALEEGS